MPAITDIFTQLDRDEGNIPTVYKDHLGFDTIGRGFLVDKRKGGGLRPEEIDFITNNRLAINASEIRKRAPWTANMDPVRFAVLLNMAYQMGVAGLFGFVNTLKMIQAGDYSGAAAGMLNSTWAKQTPERAERLSKQMKTGEWQ